MSVVQLEGQADRPGKAQITPMPRDLAAGEGSRNVGLNGGTGLWLALEE